MRRYRPSEIHHDERGCFWGITRETWAEVNYIETGPNQLRGNHYHRHTRELFFIISGQIEVTVEDLRTQLRHSLLLKKGDLLLVEPFEVHTFRTTTAAAWLNMLSVALDPERPDFHRPGEDS